MGLPTDSEFRSQMRWEWVKAAFALALIVYAFAVGIWAEEICEFFGWTQTGDAPGEETR